MSRYLCTHYEGPETWESSAIRWVDPAQGSATTFLDEEHAAETYAEQCWDGDGDPTDDVRVAVRDTETGHRWVVTVYGEAEITWHTRGAKEVPSAPAPCCAAPTCCGWEAFARAMSGVIAARLAMWERGGSAYKRERVAPVLALVSTMLDTGTVPAAAWDAEEDMRSAAYAWEEEHEQPEWWAVAGPASALVRFVRRQLDPDSDPGDAEVTAEIIAATAEEIAAVVGSAPCRRAGEVSS